MSQIEDAAQIDEDLYSRVLGTFGTETVGKILKMKVFIYGLRGVGIETAKNIILSGPKEICLYDNNIVELKDLGCNFYLKESDVLKQTRAQACQKQLQELNPYTEVNLHKSGFEDLEFLNNYNVVVMTDCYDQDLLEKINRYCRQNKIGFIFSGNLGLYGFCFVDFGDNHVVIDYNGEEPISYVVVNISQQEQGIVYTDQEKGKPHGFSTGEYVTFRDVEGMNQVNNRIFQIERKSPFSFALVNTDTRQFNPFTNSGYVEEVKIPIKQEFKSFEQSLLNPLLPDKTMLEVCDWGKLENPDQLHMIIQGIFSFFKSHNENLPQLSSQDDANELVQIVKDINESRKQNNQFYSNNLDEQLIKNVSLFARAQISPLASFWGGIVAQEIIKITGKYTPIRQWLHYDTFEALPESQNVNRETLNSRYDDYVSIFGREFLEKIQRQNTFLVGAGALGCEYIKMFALMGMGTGNKGGVIVTDDDQIEISNLTRQFLFRRGHIGQSKSECASRQGQKINDQMKIISLKDKVYEGNEKLFNDQFWDSLDLVVNAVDNLKARQYVDGRCVWHSKPLFEAGTLGTKSSSQIILPNQTSSYTDYIDPQEEQYHVCTIKNFPYQIEHTIQWAIDYFQGVMVEGPSETQKFIDNPQPYLIKVQEELRNSGIQLKQRLETIKQLANLYRSQDYSKCVLMAREIFQEVFYNQITKLLYTYPPGSLNQSGQPYWQGTKRMPNPIKFNKDDHTHVDFIQSTANIFARIIGIPYCTDRDHIKTLADQIDLPEPNFQVNKNENDDEFEDREIKNLLKELSEQYANSKQEEQSKLQIEEFEKDNAQNYHVTFIASISNLRARNYRIKEVSQLKVRFIAGKIIPAIATTTASVVGSVGIELIKYILNKPLSAFRNFFQNLGISIFVFSELDLPVVIKDKIYDEVSQGPIKAVPSSFTKWDKLVVQGPFTIQGFLDYIATQYKVKVQLISYGKLSLYNSYDGDSSQKRKNQDIKQLLESLQGEEIPNWKNNLEIGVCGETFDGVDFVMPSIKYLLQ